MSICNHIRIAAKNAQCQIAKEKQGNADDKSRGKRKNETDFGTFFNTIKSAGTNILTGKCRNSHRIAHNRKDGKTVYFCISTAAGHCNRTKSIDIALNDDVGERDNCILYSARQAYTNDFRQNRGLDLQFF